jgi:hypothetical protein
MKSSGSRGSIDFSGDYSKQAATVMARSMAGKPGPAARAGRAGRGRGDHDALSLTAGTAAGDAATGPLGKPPMGGYVLGDTLHRVLTVHSDTLDWAEGKDGTWAKVLLDDARRDFELAALKSPQASFDSALRVLKIKRLYREIDRKSGWTWASYLPRGSQRRRKSDDGPEPELAQRRHLWVLSPSLLVS